MLSYFKVKSLQKVTGRTKGKAHTYGEAHTFPNSEAPPKSPTLGADVVFGPTGGKNTYTQ